MFKVTVSTWTLNQVYSGVWMLSKYGIWPVNQLSILVSMESPLQEMSSRRSIFFPIYTVEVKHSVLSAMLCASVGVSHYRSLSL